MKTMHVSKYNGTLTIEVAEEVPNNRKSPLYVSDSGAKRLAEELKRIHDAVKANANYIGASLSFDEIDWYDDEIDVYYTPYLSIRKGKRTVDMDENSHGSIPKEWDKTITVKFKEPKQYGAVLKAISAMGVRLSESDIKELKKSLKKGKSYSHGDNDY